MLDYQNRAFAILTQAVGNSQASSASTDHDVVIRRLDISGVREDLPLRNPVGFSDGP
jgi:hypothetical protein